MKSTICLQCETKSYREGCKMEEQKALCHRNVVRSYVANGGDYVQTLKVYCVCSESVADSRQRVILQIRGWV
jgi:hypothetical protein